MKNIATTALLLTSLALPIALFSLLWSRFHLNGLVAAAIAVAIGWGLNVAWAFAAQGTTTQDPSQANAGTQSIATRFGWLCPAVLVVLAWIIWHFVTHRTA